MSALRTAYRLTTKHHFWQFHLHKEDPIFDIPKSMFMLINAKMTPKRRKRSERAKNLE